MLRQLLRKNNDLSDADWDTKVAIFFPERSGKDCRDRFQEVISKGIIRGNFTDEEDNMLRECMHIGMRLDLTPFCLF